MADNVQINEPIVVIFFDFAFDLPPVGTAATRRVLLVNSQPVRTTAGPQLRPVDHTDGLASVALTDAPVSSGADSDGTPNDLWKASSGMFASYEEDEDDFDFPGIFGKVVDTVNTARDIACVV
ncbi:hypothetical protein B0A49_13198 [Cryomyces minteri]|uniref:Uncharacterized protein n=1 Tax=Cryomyces minteri TaxID=331657 RepID=A0A4U0VRY2_9PEZI|nr:hypothetical protein B0A49_13198 [Cryomyces minteri]